MKRDKQELMRKVKALAEQGFGGEKENAKKLLQKLIDQYGPLDTESETQERERHEFRYHDELERRLLLQIIHAVTDGSDIYTAKRCKTLKILVSYCTEQEALEIETQFAFYSVHMKKELDIFFSAFCNMNNIFPKSGGVTSIDDLDKNGYKRAKRMFSMMQGMEAAKLRKMIEG